MYNINLGFDSYLKNEIESDYNKGKIQININNLVENINLKLKNIKSLHIGQFELPVKFIEKNLKKNSNDYKFLKMPESYTNDIVINNNISNVNEVYTPGTTDNSHWDISNIPAFYSNSYKSSVTNRLLSNVSSDSYNKTTQLPYNKLYLLIDEFKENKLITYQLENGMKYHFIFNMYLCNNRCNDYNNLIENYPQNPFIFCEPVKNHEIINFNEPVLDISTFTIVLHNGTEYIKLPKDTITATPKLSFVRDVSNGDISISQNPSKFLYFHLDDYINYNSELIEGEKFYIEDFSFDIDPFDLSNNLTLINNNNTDLSLNMIYNELNNDYIYKNKEIKYNKGSTELTLKLNDYKLENYLNCNYLYCQHMYPKFYLKVFDLSRESFHTAPNNTKPYLKLFEPLDCLSYHDTSNNYKCVDSDDNDISYNYTLTTSNDLNLFTPKYIRDNYYYPEKKLTKVILTYPFIDLSYNSDINNIWDYNVFDKHQDLLFTPGINKCKLKFPKNRIIIPFKFFCINKENDSC